MKNNMKINISRKTIERAIYILIIIHLVIYGLTDSEVAIKMIHAISDAYSILITNP